MQIYVFANTTAWVKYEEIFTDNYKLIKDENYLQYLKKYNDEIYDDLDSQPYKRFYTKNINTNYKKKNSGSGYKN